MPLYICNNCGFWQERFATPHDCPVCADVRHTLPSDVFLFLTAEDARRVAKTSWDETDVSIYAFRTTPSFGINPRGYLILHPHGNIAFEAAPFYTDEALDFIEQQGGIRFLSASHPHSYAAFRQLQERFRPEVVINVRDLNWTNSFRVDVPFDEEYELHQDYKLYRTGGHFDGHSVLHLAERKILFAGDALKFHLDETPVGISCHKAFNRRIPLSHAEVRMCAKVLSALDFDETYTTFEHCREADRNAAIDLFNRQLAGKPFVHSVPMLVANEGKSEESKRIETGMNRSSLV